MAPVDHEFLRRVSRIPRHGIGLSVDVYSPDLFELLDIMDSHDITYDYLEVFKAATNALAQVRRRVPSAPVEYHAEGIWLTQPELHRTYPFTAELDTAALHVGTLGSHWVNHECATKQMAGYSFGTYVAPLFTRESATITADNIRLTQETLDRLTGQSNSGGPLLLVEVPPLTYFKLGGLPVQDFFRFITDETACGLVLDIGHLWTVYRYSRPSGSSGSITEFLTVFLDRFPLERVVQIHVAGLGIGACSLRGHKETSPTLCNNGDPLWIDAHAMAVPDILFDMLDVVLADPRLSQLRGLALEVDTKSTSQIVAEFGRFSKRYTGRVAIEPQVELEQEQPVPRNAPSEAEASATRMGGNPSAARVSDLYRAYAEVISGLRHFSEVDLPTGSLDPTLLDVYRSVYLPQEILEWGGDLRDLFPDTWRTLRDREVDPEAFVSFWFRSPRSVTEPYDFFLLKLARFVEFVHEVMPGAVERARQEAQAMRAAFEDANTLAGAFEE